jgi:predicted permease
MRPIRRFVRRVGNLIFRRHDEQRLREEIEEHITQQTADNLRAGVTYVEARRRALLKFGAAEAIKESYRAERGMPLIESVVQDLGFAVRMLVKSPGFAAVAILTLALGIGANTAIFSVIDAVMLRPLPVEQGEKLLLFTWSARHDPNLRGQSSYGDCDDKETQCSFSVPFFQSTREKANLFSNLAAFAGPFDINFRCNAPAEIGRGEFVSGDFFSTVGLKTIIGRPLGPSDDSPTAPPAIVLNYGYWQREFGPGRSAIGQTVRLNNVEAEIVGVADPRYASLTPGKTQDFFMPLSLSKRVRSEWWGDADRLADPAIWWVVLVGKLAPSISLEQAQSALSTMFESRVLSGPRPIFGSSDAPSVKLLPARQGLNGESSYIAPMLKLIMAAVVFVLIIACVNIAGLMLARATKRQKEMAMRQVLGAGRGRLARQLLTESLVLSLAGAALGIGIAIWGAGGIAKLISSGFGEPFPFVIAPDWRVTAFIACVALAAGILAGLAPAFRGPRADLTFSLRETASSVPGGAQGRRRLRLSDSLVVAQVALSIVVLAGAGLLVRSLHKLQMLDPGFDTRNILLFSLNPTIAGYKDDQTMQLYRQLQQRFAALPGVISATYSENALLSGDWSASDVHLDGAPPKSNVNPATLTVGLDFFSTMRIPLLAGRAFVAADFASAHAARLVLEAAEAKSTTPGDSAKSKEAPAPQVAPVPVLINRAFARAYFPHQDPVGKHIGHGQHDDDPKGPLPGYRIVGMVGDTKYNNLRREIKPTMYLPLVENSANFELRTVGDPNALVQTVRGIVTETDSGLPVFHVRTQAEQIDQILFQERLMSSLSSFFALLALALACIGLYGLLSYEVARRTRELGIRMALGADKRHLMRMVLRQGLLLALLGSVIGIGAAFGVTHLMASLLYEVRPDDPATFAFVCFLLLLVAAAACLIPARRATRVEPIEALRTE